MPSSSLIVLAAWVPFQDYVISPRVSAKTMQLAPAAAVISLLIGGAVFGPLGGWPCRHRCDPGVATAFVPRHRRGERGNPRKLSTRRDQAREPETRP